MQPCNSKLSSNATCQLSQFPLTLTVTPLLKDYVVSADVFTTAGSPVTPGTGGDTDLLNDDGSHQNRLSDPSPEAENFRSARSSPVSTLPDGSPQQASGDSAARRVEADSVRHEQQKTEDKQDRATEVPPCQVGGVNSRTTRQTRQTSLRQYSSYKNKHMRLDAKNNDNNKSKKHKPNVSK
ncbi:hypothetical protein BaRGS_00030891 [Batillaria attramentaria]|uniref:Uncharacterized protein n=1 Tax=Batillaria attramentaria TaxID=370345 RepID=A0ABD0JTD9_9CAEN